MPEPSVPATSAPSASAEIVDLVMLSSDDCLIRLFLGSINAARRAFV
jgi:hypothetical protein